MLFWREVRWRSWQAGYNRYEGVKGQSMAYIKEFLDAVCTQCNDGNCPECQCFFIHFDRRDKNAKYCWR